MPDCLEAFPLRHASAESSQNVNQNVTAFVHKHRQRVIKWLTIPRAKPYLHDAKEKLKLFVEVAVSSRHVLHRE